MIEENSFIFYDDIVESGEFFMSITKKKIYLILLIFVVFISVVIFNDVSISRVIYNPTSDFARFFEIVSTLPLNIIGVFGSMALIMTAKHKMNFSTIVSYGIGFVLLALFAVYGCNRFTHALPEGTTLIMVTTVGWIYTSIVLVGFIMKSGYKQELRNAAVVMVIGSCVAVFGPMIIKCCIANLTFPSSLSAQSTLSLCVLLVPSFVKKLDTKKYYQIAGTIAGLFILCVMLFCMILGLNYATDVCTGAILTIFTMMLVNLYVQKKGKVE